MLFSIIIPLFNEEKNIEKLVDEICNTNLIVLHKFEIILINDSSTDNTLLKIKILSKKYPDIVKFINNNKNLGQSLSIVSGIKKAMYNNIITLDGDGQNNPKDISLLIKKYEQHNDVHLVSGLRKNRKDSNVKIISSKIANKIRKKILNDDCDDTGCSLKIFDKDIFLKFPSFDGIHRFLPALFKGYGKNVIYVNVDHRPRIHGKSKYGTLGRMFRGIRDIIKVMIIIKNLNLKDLND